MVNKSSDVVYGEDLCWETTFQQGKKREACGLTENKVMELQLLFLFRHLAQFRDIFPTNYKQAGVGFVLRNSVALNLTRRCQPSVCPGQSSGPKVLVWQGACTAEALTRHGFFILPGMLSAMAALPLLSLSGCVTLTSAVTWLVQLQLRRILCFSSRPLQSNKVQRTRWRQPVKITLSSNLPLPSKNPH